jgi:hypothetical protein
MAHRSISIVAVLRSIGDNLILPLLRRALNQVPRGIGQFREQPLRNIDSAIDLVRATIRCATSEECKAFGGHAYHCAKVPEAHPAEFAELRAEWESS